MENVNQQEVLKYCIRHHIPFAISKLPGITEDKLIVSKQVREIAMNQFFDFNDNDGFVIAPFSLSQENPQFLSADYEIGQSAEGAVFNEIRSLKFSHHNEGEKSYYADYCSYEKQYQSMYQAIKRGRVSKVILSRIKQVKGFSRELAADFYYKLSESYPKAYVFMVFSPQSGLWVGASPELLFRVENQEATTVSLAGTQKWNSDASINWDEKEKDEQQIVSDFINEILGKYNIVNASVEGPQTIKAGKISHLKTQYNFPIQSIKYQIGDFISDIHPTPAVCGLPKNESMDIICKIENHQRSYYAGFLGRIKNGDMNLFVNIRSMKFVNDGVDLYLGGGITIGSDPENEWKETELKAETLLTVIEKIKSSTGYSPVCK